MSNQEPDWACFEDEVYNAVKKAVSSGHLPFDENNVSVRRAAEYSTPSSESTIKIEVSLKVFRRDATEPFQVWLWECKHKDSRNVEVGDVRELHSKIHEIGSGRTSGSIVTTVGFQSGAIKLAEKVGISLYLLKKELIAITKYARTGSDELREVIFAERSFDFSGKERLKTRFDDLVLYGLQQMLSVNEPRESNT